MMAGLSGAGIFDLAGIAGVAFYLGSYFALQAGFIRGSGYLYAVLNLAASSLVLVSLFNSFNVYSATIQVSWIVISIFGLTRLYLMARSIRFTEEEEGFRREMFEAMDRKTAFRLIRGGTWREAAPGEILVKEGARVSALTFLASGTAEVRLDGVLITQMQAPALVGEMGVLSGLPATATVTVTLSEPARIWQHSADRLEILVADTEIGLQIEGALSRDMRQKLIAGNLRAKQIDEARSA